MGDSTGLTFIAPAMSPAAALATYRAWSAAVKARGGVASVIVAPGFPNHGKAAEKYPVARWTALRTTTPPVVGAAAGGSKDGQWIYVLAPAPVIEAARMLGIATPDEASAAGDNLTGGLSKEIRGIVITAIIGATVAAVLPGVLERMSRRGRR